MQSEEDPAIFRKQSKVFPLQQENDAIEMQQQAFGEEGKDVDPLIPLVKVELGPGTSDAHEKDGEDGDRGGSGNEGRWVCCDGGLSEDDDDSDDDDEDDMKMQRLPNDIESLKPLLNNDKKKPKSLEEIKMKIERRGWEVTGFSSFKPEEQLASTFTLPDEDTVISNGFYEVKINRRNPHFTKIFRDMEKINKTSEKEIMFGENDNISYKLEEEEIESSNSLLYLSGIKRNAKFIAGLVLLSQVAIFFICFLEASKNDVVKARNEELVITRVFVAASFSFLMTNSFTDSWLTMATATNCAGHVFNGYKYLKLAFAMPSIIGGILYNFVLLVIGVLLEFCWAIGFFTFFTYISISRMLDGDCSSSTFGWRDLFLPTHFLTLVLITPAAFILESALNVFACMAVLVVTKQLDSATDTVANFAGLMTILELDAIVISFMDLDKIRSLIVERKKKKKDKKSSAASSALNVKTEDKVCEERKDAEPCPEEEARSPTALPSKQNNQLSTKLEGKFAPAQEGPEKILQIKEHDQQPTENQMGTEQVITVEDKSLREEILPAKQDTESTSKAEEKDGYTNQGIDVSAKEVEKVTIKAAPPIIMDVHSLKISIFLYLFVMSAVYLLL